MPAFAGMTKEESRLRPASRKAEEAAVTPGDTKPPFRQGPRGQRRSGGPALPWGGGGEPAGGPAEPGTLEGAIERVVFHAEETGWSVVRLARPPRGEIVTAVGAFPGARAGESVRLQGRWVTDLKYGRQFRAETCLILKPSTVAGIEKYLGSGLIPGIGPAFAERLVARFGIRTLEVIENHPDQLAEVEGIGRVRSDRIRAAWEAQRGIQEVMVFLHAHGISPSHAVRIHRMYGKTAPDLLRENPYRLASDIPGIGFLTADRIARGLGVPADSPRRARAAVLHALSTASDEGHCCLPRPDLEERTVRLLARDSRADGVNATATATTDDVLKPGPDPSSYAILAVGAVDELLREEALVDDGAIYPHPLHAAETLVAARLAQLMRGGGGRIPPIAADRAVAWFESKGRITLAAAQREALRRALESRVLVLTGGPGTGKTTLVRGVIRILEAKGARIALCAPTGRAAQRLSETTGHEAKTIHRLLEFQPRGGGFARNGQRPLEADLVVVDETSMVDLPLAARLLEAVPAGCRLLFVGDADQLPSVGPGNVLRDLIASGAIEVARLTEIFRQAAESLIVVNAHRVQRGEMPLPGRNAEGALAGPAADSDFYFIEKEEPEDILKVLRELIVRRIPSRFQLDPVEDIQVLTPMRKGLLGTGNLNVELQALLTPEVPAGAAGRLPERGADRSAGPEATEPLEARSGAGAEANEASEARTGAGTEATEVSEARTGPRAFRRGDKVMQIRNDYEREVFNGDIGRVVRCGSDGGGTEVRFGGRLVAYEAADLDKLTLAYACTIHKSQGSEYPAVIVPLHTQHAVMLQRNLLYTAMTRGRKLVIIVGTRRALGMAVGNNRIRERHTRLADRLKRAVARS